MNAHLAYRITSTLQLPAQGDPTVVSINPEGTLIAVGSVGGHVHVWCLSSYELLCQTSPPPEEGGSADAQIGNMAWMPNGLLVFSRRNGILGMLLVGKHFIEAVSIAVHDHLPVLAMDYSDTLSVWATATNNEIAFVRWKRSDWNTFYARPEDRIIAKRVAVSSEGERPVVVTSLNWIKKSSTVAHLLVAFLHHYVEIIDGDTRNVLTHVAIHTPVCSLSISPDQTRALVTNTSGGLIIYNLSSAHVITCASGIQGLGQGSPALFAHGGDVVLVGCEDGRVKLFDPASASWLRTLNHEGGGNIIAMAVHASYDPDRFVIATAVSGNMNAEIFVWQTVEHGPNLGGEGSNAVPWIRILRVVFAWTALIVVVLARHYGSNHGAWVRSPDLDKIIGELRCIDRFILDILRE